MKIVGIICEYNPFHNGHLYHINKIKELFPDSLIILVLNGYFLQRGDISIISKKNKTNIALLYGIDLIVELPFVFGTQSADTFANCAITLLSKLKCEYLVFGSESNNIEILDKISTYMLTNKEEYDEKIQEYLNNGENYPTALAKALNITFDFKPNDLLGISYLKSIKQNNYNIKCLTIQRTNDYLDTTSNEEIISATNIREKLLNNIDISKFVPSTTLTYINNINLDAYFNTLKYKIITETNLEQYLDVDEGIENRLKKVINDCHNMNDLIMNVKSKRYTYNKIKRMLIHILIGLTKTDNQNLKLEYIKILGFNSNGKKYLNKIKKDVDLPLIPLKNSLQYIYELRSAAIYDLVDKNNNLIYETSNKPLKF